MACARASPDWLLLLSVLHLSAGGAAATFMPADTPRPPDHVPYRAWSGPIKAGVCAATETATETGGGGGGVTCTVGADGTKAYRFPPGIFEIDEQLLVPDNTSITGAKGCVRTAASGSLPALCTLRCAAVLCCAVPCCAVQRLRSPTVSGSQAPRMIKRHHPWGIDCRTHLPDVRASTARPHGRAGVRSVRSVRSVRA